MCVLDVLEETHMKRGTVLLVSILLFLVAATTSEVFGQTDAATKLVQVSSNQLPFNVVSHAFAEWQRGSFVFVSDRFSSTPVLQFFDKNGQPTSTYSFSIPKAGLIQLYDNSIAIGPNGSLAITGTAFSDDSREGRFLALVSPDRQEQTVIRISPFNPRAVAIATDGTVWLAGDQTKPRYETQDHSQLLIRHYDTTGKLLGTFISWSDVQSESRTLPPTSYSILFSLKDGMGWYSPRSGSYMELSSNGSVVRRLKTGEHPEGSVIQATACTDGNVYVTTEVPTDNADVFHWGIYVLNPREGTWTLQSIGDRSGLLLGCDGTQLAITSDFKTVTWLSPAAK
jgi:hypothetical protein